MMVTDTKIVTFRRDVDAPFANMQGQWRDSHLKEGLWHYLGTFARFLSKSAYA